MTTHPPLPPALTAALTGFAPHYRAAEAILAGSRYVDYPDAPRGEWILFGWRQYDASGLTAEQIGTVEEANAEWIQIHQANPGLLRLIRLGEAEPFTYSHTP